MLQAEGLTFPVYRDYFSCIAGEGVDFFCLYRVYLVRCCRCTRRGLLFLSIESIFCVLQAEVFTFPVYIDYFLVCCRRRC
jgi:hypothetical protein